MGKLSKLSDNSKAGNQTSTNWCEMPEIKASDDITYRLAIEEAIAKTSQIIISRKPSDFKEILEILGNTIGVHRTYIFRLDESTGRMSNIWEWHSRRLSKEFQSIQDLDIEKYRWWEEQLSKREYIYISGSNNLPPEAGPEREMLENQGVKSLLAVPIYSDDSRVMGFIGFDDMDRERQWLSEDIRALKVIAEMIGIFWERNTSKEILDRTIHKFKAMINTVPAIMFIKNMKYEYEEVNDSFLNSVGKERDEIIGKTDYELFPKEKAEAFKATDDAILVKAKESVHREEKIDDSQGHVRWISTTKVPFRDEENNVIGIVGLTQDITEEHIRREQMMQTDKLAAIGTLAAGVAHEINNPMGYISSNLNIMNKYLQKMNTAYKENKAIDNNNVKSLGEILDDFADAIEESMEGASRVKKIVADLKSFSRVDKAEKGYSNINEGLESTLNIVWNELKYKCTVEKDLGELPDLLCYASQLNQVFLNLLINAGHAIVDKSGIIKIKTWADEENIHVSIKDNGCGIPEQNLDKIFEPFFTTKEVGKGTGLGLSLVFDIIQKHKGNIKVESKENIGTEFIITLPLNGLVEE